MTRPPGDRRRAERRTPAGTEPLARIRLRAGSHLEVIDVSNAGVLVEGEARLLPGTHADVHIITTEGRTLVRSRVVRACVVHVEAERVRYRGALAFERAVDTAAARDESLAPPHETGYSIPSDIARAESSQGIVYPHAATARTVSDVQQT
jgi:hypothetical protein